MSLTPVIQQLNRFECAGILISKVIDQSRIYSFNPKSQFRNQQKRLFVAFESISIKEKENIFHSRRRPGIVSPNYADDVTPEVMASIGFKKGTGRHYVHPKCKLLIEFVSGPLGIGDDVDIKPKPVKIVKIALFSVNPPDIKRLCILHDLCAQLLSGVESHSKNSNQLCF